MSFKCWKALGSPTLVLSHTVQKASDRHSFSPHELIVSFPFEWGRKIVTIDAPTDYSFILGLNWIHTMIGIVSSEPRVIWLPHWGEIFMIDQLDYCILETAIQSNVHFIRDALK